MEYRTAMIVATPNSISVKLTCRSRTTDWSTALVRPKMLYSPVWASASDGISVWENAPDRVRDGVGVGPEQDLLVLQDRAEDRDRRRGRSRDRWRRRRCRRATAGVSAAPTSTTTSTTTTTPAARATPASAPAATLGLRNGEAGWND